MSKKVQPPADPAAPSFVPVCAIGASAGGVGALQTLFRLLPDELGLAYVIVVHLSPDHPSAMHEILGACTKMPVYQVNDGPTLQANCVYVIAPDTELVIEGDHIQSRPFSDLRSRRAPIDMFFRSIAAGRGDGIAVVLTGAGSDGALGVRAIKEAGGIIMVQEPAEAGFPSMPQNAIATGVADVVAPLARLAERIAEAAHSKEAVRSLDEDDVANDVRRIVTFLRTRTGHDFSGYKRSTVFRRIQRRMQVCQIAEPADYLQFLRANPEEAKELLSDLLISVTMFFRDPETFITLSHFAIRPLLESRNEGETEEGVRAWVVGCATGEEAYSLAILLLEEAEQLKISVPIQIFATDLDEGALATAREGRYPRTIEADMSAERLKRFFVDEGTHYRIDRRVRDLILFAAHSVVREPPFMRLDLITCRNVLIYLERALQKHVNSIFRYGLKADGYLFLGPAETVDSTENHFAVVDRDARIYRALPARPDFVPTLAASGGWSAGRPALTESRLATARLNAGEVLGESHAAALEASAPPSALVDAEQAVLHLSPSVGRYVLLSAGPLSGRLPSIVRPELRLDLKLALDRAFDARQPTITRPLDVAMEGDTRRVSLHVAPLPIDEGGAARAIVYFLDNGPGRTETDEDSVPPPDELQHLHSELKVAQEAELAGRIRNESAVQELRASNEELQSLNEEYRSTAEELETSKEELQSINEELQTVNAELKSKLGIISAAHNDLQNLTASSEIGTLFLDLDLRIRMFTPPVAELINVAEADIGRPITNFTHRLQYDDLSRDVRDVLRELSPLEREVRTVDGRWFYIRMRPYRTVEGKVEGAVATFDDITERKVSEAALRESEKLRGFALDSGRMGAWSWDTTRDQIRGDAVFMEVYGFPPSDEAFPLSRFTARMSPEAAAACEAVAARALTPEEEFEGDLALATDATTGRWVRWRGRAGRDTPSQIHGVSFDITEPKLAEQKLRESEERQAFLLRLSDTLRPLADPAEVQAEAMRVLGQHLGANRVHYAEMEADADTAEIVHNYTDEAEPLLGQVRLSDFGTSATESMRAGRVVVMPDTLAEPTLSDAERAAFAAFDIRACVAVPLVKGERLVAMLVAHNSTPRAWTPAEVALVEETAERTWSAVERTRAETALRESEQALASDLANAERLRSLSERLMPEENFQAIYDEILSATVAITRADAGTVQIYDPGTKTLELIASQNFSRTITDYYQRVDADSRSACGVALKTGERAFVDFPSEVDDSGCQLLVGEGIQSAVAYPLMSRTGVPLGMLNAHWRHAKHRPNEREQRFLDLLARQAADLIEQRRSQSALRESEEKYRALLAGSPVPSIVVAPNTPDYTILDVNDVYVAATLGTREALIGRKLFDVFVYDPSHPGLQGTGEVARSFERVLATRHTDVMPRVRQDMMTPEGELEPHWWLGINAPMLDPDGNVIAIIHQATRVTEQYHAEETLRRSEDRFRALATTGAASFYRMSPDWGRVLQLDANEFVSPIEGSETNWLSAQVHADDHERVAAAVARAIASHSAFELEHRVPLADGRTGWIISRAVPLLDDEGQIREWFGTVTDITARKIGEEALRESEELRRIALESGRMGSWEWDTKNATIRSDAVVQALWGVLTLEQPHSVALYADLMHPEGVAWLEAVAAKEKAPGEEIDTQLEVATGPASSRWVQLRGRAERDAPWIINGVTFDITEQKLAEQRLAESEAKYAGLFEASPAPFLILKPDAPHFTITEVNDAYLAGTLRTREAVIGRGIFEVFPDNPGDPASAGPSTLLVSLEHVLASCRPDVLPAFKYDLTRPDGTFEERWWSPINSPVLNESGEVEAIIHNANDVTDQHRVVSALRESEEQFRRSVLEAPIPVIMHAEDGEVLQVSRSWTDLTGYTVDDSHIIQSWLTKAYGFGGKDVRDAMEQAFRQGALAQPMRAIPFEIVTRQGEHRHWSFSASSPGTLGDGRRFVIGMAEDITERVRAETELRYRGEQLHTLIERATTGIYLVDADFRILQVNAIAKPVFGDVADLIGRDFGDVIHILWEDSYADEVTALFRHTFETGEPYDTPERAQFRADRGVMEYYSWRIERITLPDGRYGVVCYFADVSEQVRARLAVAELFDRQGVLVAELQHRTRNLIGVVRSLVGKTIESANSLEDFEERFGLRLAALSRVQGLLSHLSAGERVTFDDVLVAELSALGALEGNGRGPKVTLVGPSGVRLRSATVQTFALAIHELATNAVKYGALSAAAPGGHLAVRWQIEPSDGDSSPRLLVEWQESGVAMPDTDAPARGGGYGRELIERALPYQLGANTSYELGVDGVRCTIAVTTAGGGEIEE